MKYRVFKFYLQGLGRSQEDLKEIENYIYSMYKKLNDDNSSHYKLKISLILDHILCENRKLDEVSRFMGIEISSSEKLQGNEILLYHLELGSDKDE